MKNLSNIVVLADLVLVGETDQDSIGGWGASFALHLHKSGCEVNLASSVGADEDGAKVLHLLHSQGMDVSLIGVEPMLKTPKLSPEAVSFGVASLEIPKGAFDITATSPGLKLVAASSSFTYYNSVSIRGIVTKNTLRKIVGIGPDAFNMFDIRFANEVTDEATIKLGLNAADLVHVSLVDLPYLTRILNFPSLDITESVEALMERFRLSALLLNDRPYSSTLFLHSGERLQVPTETTSLDDPSSFWGGESLAKIVIEKYGLIRGSLRKGWGSLGSVMALG